MLKGLVLLITAISIISLFGIAPVLADQNITMTTIDGQILTTNSSTNANYTMRIYIYSENTTALTPINFTLTNSTFSTNITGRPETQNEPNLYPNYDCLEATKNINLAFDPVSKPRYFCTFHLTQDNVTENSVYNLTFYANDSNNVTYQPYLQFKVSPIVSEFSRFEVTDGINFINDTNTTNTSILLSIYDDAGPGYISWISIALYNQTPNIPAYDPFNTSRFIDFIPEWGSDIAWYRFSDWFWADLRIHYTSQEILDLGLEESTLKMQSYNESTGVWDTCGGVNMTGKYIFCNTTHFSTWVPTGNAIQPQNMSIVIPEFSIIRPNATDETFNLFAYTLTEDYSVFSNTSFQYYLSNSTSNIPVEALDVFPELPSNTCGVDAGPYGTNTGLQHFFCKFVVNQSLLKTNSFYNITLEATDDQGNTYNPTAPFKIAPSLVSQSYWNVSEGVFVIDDTLETNVTLTVNFPSSGSRVITIATYNETPDTIQAYDPFNTSQFIEFVPDWEGKDVFIQSLVDDGFWVEIKIYYTDEQIAELGIDESILNLRSYNESTQEWDSCGNGGVNTTGNYVYCNSTHFSTWVPTVSQESESSSSSSSSSSGGGGGGGGGGGTAVNTTETSDDNVTIQTQGASETPETTGNGVEAPVEADTTGDVTEEDQGNLITGFFTGGEASTTAIILTLVGIGAVVSFFVLRKMGIKIPLKMRNKLVFK